MNRIQCRYCRWRGTDKEILKAPNPFLQDENVYGCPECKTIYGFDKLCETPDCLNEASIGTPTTDGGYKHHCHHHYPENAKP